jgi:hypothetical protein
MAEQQFRGKSLSAIAKDVADGFIVFNPLVLKSLDASAYRELLHQLKKAQQTARAAKFPTNDIDGIRKRNMRLQRLHQALTILEHEARERRFSLA